MVWMRTLLAFVPILGVLFACSNNNAAATAAGTGGGGGAPAGVGVTTASSGGGDGCQPQPGVEPGPDWVCITEVTGTLVDETDSPVSGMLMTVCGPGGCEPNDSDATGKFVVTVGFPIFVDDWSTIPHGRDQDKFVYYFAFDPASPGPVIDLGTVRVLDAPSDGVPIVVKTDNAGAPAQSVVHGGVTLTVPAGVRVSLDFDDVAIGDKGKLFRAREVPTEFLPDFVDPALSVMSLYALTPFDSRFDLEDAPGTDAKATLSFPNTTGLTGGSAVEFLQLGSFIVGNLQTADYEVVATGTVSADGTSIDMDPGEGITFVTWIAIREPQ